MRKVIQGRAPYNDSANIPWYEETLLGYLVCFSTPDGPAEIDTEAKSADAAIDQAEDYLLSIGVTKFTYEGWYPV